MSSAAPHAWWERLGDRTGDEPRRVAAGVLAAQDERREPAPLHLRERPAELREEGAVARHPAEDRHPRGRDVAVEPGGVDGRPAAGPDVRVDRELAEHRLHEDGRQHRVALAQVGRAAGAADAHLRPRRGGVDARRDGAPADAGGGLHEHVRRPGDAELRRLAGRHEQLVRADVGVGHDGADRERGGAELEPAVLAAMAQPLLGGADDRLADLHRPQRLVVAGGPEAAQLGHRCAGDVERDRHPGRDRLTRRRAGARQPHRAARRP